MKTKLAFLMAGLLAVGCADETDPMAVGEQPAIDLSGIMQLSSTLEMAPDGTPYLADPSGEPIFPGLSFSRLQERFPVFGEPWHAEDVKRQLARAPECFEGGSCPWAVREYREMLLARKRPPGLETDDVAPGPMCGIEGEYYMEMKPGWGTEMTIEQDPATGDVMLKMYAEQETTVHHPPGDERQKARPHEVEMLGSITAIGDSEIPATARWPNGHLCVEAAWAGRDVPIPASQIFAPVTLCIEAGTTHYATNDHTILQSFHGTSYDRKCMKVCPLSDMDCDDPRSY